jgi:hypothetical protein
MAKVCHGRQREKAAITQAAKSLEDGRKLIPSATLVFNSRSDMYVYLQG